VLDYAQLDEKAMGMVWVLSNTMTQPISEALMTWFRSSGVSEIMLPGERLSVIHETRPLPMTLLSGLSLHLCLRLLSQIEELTFAGQVWIDSFFNVLFMCKWSRMSMNKIIAL
jgi:mediator of RNA polymerase II transcription subunit 23